MHPAAWAVWGVHIGASCRFHFLMNPYSWPKGCIKWADIFFREPMGAGARGVTKDSIKNRHFSFQKSNVFFLIKLFF